MRNRITLSVSIWKNLHHVVNTIGENHRILLRVFNYGRDTEPNSLFPIWTRLGSAMSVKLSCKIQYTELQSILPPLLSIFWTLSIMIDECSFKEAWCFVCLLCLILTWDLRWNSYIWSATEDAREKNGSIYRFNNYLIPLSILYNKSRIRYQNGTLLLYMALSCQVPTRLPW